MRALVLDGVGFDRLHIAQVPVPRPGPHQMLARVDAGGICTSLIKLVEQGPAHRFLYGWDVAGTLELLAAGEIDAGKHINRVDDLDHAVEFLEMVKAQRIDGKVIIYPHRRDDRILAVSSWSAQDECAYLLPAGSSP